MIRAGGVGVGGGDGVKSGRRDNLDECTFNWVQQRLAV